MWDAVVTNWLGAKTEDAVAATDEVEANHQHHKQMQKRTEGCKPQSPKRSVNKRVKRQSSEYSEFTSKFIRTSFDQEMLQKMRDLNIDSIYDDSALSNVVATEESISPQETAAQQASPKSDFASSDDADTGQKTYEGSICDLIAPDRKAVPPIPNPILRRRPPSPAKDIQAMEPQKQSSLNRVKFAAKLDDSDRKPPSKPTPQDTDDFETFNSYDMLNDPNKLQENIIQNLRQQLLELTVESNEGYKKLADTTLELITERDELALQNKELEEKLEQDKENHGADLNKWIKKCSDLKAEVGKLEKQVKAQTKNHVNTPPDGRKQLDPDGSCSVNDDVRLNVQSKINDLEDNYNIKLQQLNTHVVMLNSEVGFWKREHGNIKMQLESLIASNARTEFERDYKQHELDQSKQVVASLQKQIEKLTRALALKEKKCQCSKRSALPSLSKRNLNSNVATGPGVKLSLGDVKQASSRNFSTMSSIFHHRTSNAQDIPQTDDNNDTSGSSNGHFTGSFTSATKFIPQEPTRSESCPTLQTSSRDKRSSCSSATSLVSNKSEESIAFPERHSMPNLGTMHSCTLVESEEDLCPTGSKPRRSYNVRWMKSSMAETAKNARCSMASSTTDTTEAMSDDSDVHSSSDDSSDSSSSSSSSSSSPASTASPGAINEEVIGSVLKNKYHPDIAQTNPNDTVTKPHNASGKPPRSILKQNSRFGGLGRSSVNSTISLDLGDLEADALNISVKSNEESIVIPEDYYTSETFTDANRKVSWDNTENSKSYENDLAPTVSKPRQSFASREMFSQTQSPTPSIGSTSDETDSWSPSESSEDTPATLDEEMTSMASTISGSVCGNLIEMNSQQDTTETCMVAHMPYHEKQSDVDGLYSGSIDIATKLPSGFGALKCENGDVLSGNWKMGVLCIK